MEQKTCTRISRISDMQVYVIYARGSRHLVWICFSVENIKKKNEACRSTGERWVTWLLLPTEVSDITSAPRHTHTPGGKPLPGVLLLIMAACHQTTARSLLYLNASSVQGRAREHESAQRCPRNNLIMLNLDVCTCVRLNSYGVRRQTRHMT